MPGWVLLLTFCIYLAISYSSMYLRYPYEAIRVVTADGYVLLLERIPRYESTSDLYIYLFIFEALLWFAYLVLDFFLDLRLMSAMWYCRRDSRKAVYLQHGVLDSSMGWVTCFYLLFFHHLWILIFVQLGEKENGQSPFFFLVEGGIERSSNFVN